MEPLNVKSAPYSAVGNGIADDTAAIQQAIDDAANGCQAVYIPPGRYKITGLKLTTAGDTVTTTFVSLRGANPVFSVLVYSGPTDGTALKISRNKFFEVSGLRIENAGAKGTTQGIHLTGPLTTGTQTLGGILKHLIVSGFNVGIMAGGPGGGKAASEMLYQSVELHNNNIGWQGVDFNTLNHVFQMLLLGENGVGLDTVSCNVAVYGGSASGSTIADFRLLAPGSPFSVRDVRSETANRFMVAQNMGMVTVDSCAVTHITNADNIAIDVEQPSQFRVVSSRIEGKLRILHYGQLQIDNCRIRSDSALPFSVKPGSSGPLQYSIRNCHNLTSGKPFADCTGRVQEGEDRSIERCESMGGTLPAISYHRVRSLSAGSQTAGNNLRLQAKFNGTGSVNVPFVRTISVTTQIGGRDVIFSPGAILPTDVGRKIVFVGAGTGGVDVTNKIESLLSANRFRIENIDGGFPMVAAVVTARIGEDEPDANYLLTLGASAAERIGWSNKSATGFTLTSDNPTSTIQVDCVVMR